MPENPLLPHRKLKELYLLMLRCRDLERKGSKSKAGSGAREAWLAATTMQMLPGDLLCAEPGDATAELLAPAGKTPKLSGTLTALPTARLLTCAAAALGLKAAGSDALVLVCTCAGSVEPGWQQALAWALEQRLPLVLLCEDFANGGKSRTNDVLSWAALEALGRKRPLPVLAVDGHDAVAVYRAMQESVIRARSGAGMAIIWAVTTPKTKVVSRNQQPLARLLTYLKVRNIAPPRRP